MNNNIIRQFTLSPKTLFLVDSLGALVTAFFLFAILRTFNEYVGMPQTALTYLSLIAVIFSLYSIACFFLLEANWQPFLRTISIANLLYCCLTMGLVIYYYPSLTILGITYFLAEIIVVCGLVFVELKTLRGKQVRK
jgi:peptidoglycan biosynthesis protein MviN/MurJ (putative lipid II flippase)